MEELKEWESGRAVDCKVNLKPVHSEEGLGSLKSDRRRIERCCFRSRKAGLVPRMANAEALPYNDDVLGTQVGRIID